MAAKKRVTKKPRASKPAVKKAAKRAAKAKPRRAAKKPTSQGPDPRAMKGWITHTDFASNDPEATKDWCAKALGWKFGQAMPMPDGSMYHMFRYAQQGGGGIRKTGAGESTSALPYVSVLDCHKAYAKALAAGAEGVSKPEKVADTVTIATVRAPGGVLIGLAGP